MAAEVVSTLGGHWRCRSTDSNGIHTTADTMMFVADSDWPLRFFPPDIGSEMPDCLLNAVSISCDAVFPREMNGQTSSDEH